MTPPAHARVVIVGGGVSGCSVAYHLVKQGWTDVVLLERKRLTSGTTWHAAGLVAQLRATAAMTRLAKYTQELYGALEAETGVATGFKRVGSISMALTEARKEELLRQASMARAFGVEAEPIGPAEIAARHPLVETGDAKVGVYLSQDGQADPAAVALAMARGARNMGAQLFENVKMIAAKRAGRRILSLDWASAEGRGTIACEHVVNCAGMWGRDVGEMLGAPVPLQACEHFYVVTPPIPNLGALPVLRVPDECAYYKADAGRMMLGAFEPKAKPWGLKGIPEEFEFDQLPDDLDHLAPVLEAGMARMPAVSDAGIQTFFNGPESFTPDNAYHLGLAPEMDNVWVAAGFNSIGIQSAGGAGMALAAWMETGEAPFDLGAVDAARTSAFQKNRRYLAERATESLGLLYADHFPTRQKATARGVRRSPVHAHLVAEGAALGETAGWERPLWFARGGAAREYPYGWGREGWFEASAAEHRAMRQGVGLYDMSSFGKLRIEGPDAEAFLNEVASAEMAVPEGRIVYTCFLNSRGGVEADGTVVRLSETAFLLVTAAATLRADEARLRRQIRDRRVVVTDVTAGEAALAVMGPKARDLMRAVSPDDWSDAALPLRTAREVEIGMGTARAHRLSYVGALGWELFVPADQAAHVFETLAEAGAGLGLAFCGMYAVNSCRIEKAFRHMGHDMSPEDHVVEAGLGHAVGWRKPAFLGRDAALRVKEAGPERRLIGLLLDDAEATLHHNEPILRDGRIVGRIASAGHGHSVGGPVGLGYVEAPEPGAGWAEGAFEVEIAGRRVSARASLKAFYDPAGVEMAG